MENKIPPDSFEWLDDPVTISVDDYIDRIAKAVYPDYPLSKAKNKVHLAIRNGKTAKKNPLHLLPAPSPFPEGHVFAEEVFRWLARRWPGRISWLHPHYGRAPLSTCLTTSWRNKPNFPLSHQQLEREVERLGAENKKLVSDLREMTDRALSAERKLKFIQDRAKKAHEKKKATGNLGGRPKYL